MKIRPVATKLFDVDGRADWQTDRTKLIAAFRNFANAPKTHQIFNFQVPPSAHIPSSTPEQRYLFPSFPQVSPQEHCTVPHKICAFVYAV